MRRFLVPLSCIALAVTMSAQDISPANNLISGPNGSKVQINLDGSITITAANGGAVNVTSGDVYVPSMLDFSTSVDNTVSANGHFKLKFDGSGFKASLNGAAFATFGGNVSTTDVGVVTDAMLANAVKPAVAVVATSNLTLSGEQTIDGQLTSGSLVLATGQTTGSQNGPWVSAAGAWTRPSWYTNGSASQAPQFLTTFVRLGGTYQGSTWRMTTSGVVIGTTSTTWVQTPTNLNSVVGTMVNPTFDGATIANGSLTISGNISAAAWTTNGLRIKGIAGTLTDTSSSGTVAAAYTNKLGGNTIAASSAATFTDYISLYASDPVAGSNVTLTNKWALGADSLRVGTSNPLTVSNAGVLNATAAGRFVGLGINGASSSPTTVDIYNATPSMRVQLGVSGSNVGVMLGSGGATYWGSGSSPSAYDTGLARNAAGVVEINNGTAGGAGALLMTGAPAANTAAAGLTLQDTTAATSSNQQYSPYIYQTGQGWKTTATAGSQSVTFRQGVVPIQGTANPTGNYVIDSSINGGAFTNALTLDWGGGLTATSLFSGTSINNTANTYFGSYTGNTEIRGLRVGSGNSFGFGNGGANAAPDTSLTRGAAKIVGLSDGGTAGGTFRSIPTSPTQIAADQNNYNPGGSSYYQRLSTDASRSITGLTFTAAQVDGQTHVIVNVGAQNIVIVNESASSTAANRFHNSTGADITLAADQEVNCWYDATTARWRVSKRGF